MAINLWTLLPYQALSLDLRAFISCWSGCGVNRARSIEPLCFAIAYILGCEVNASFLLTFKGTARPVFIGQGLCSHQFSGVPQPQHQNLQGQESNLLKSTAIQDFYTFFKADTKDQQDPILPFSLRKQALLDFNQFNNNNRILIINHTMLESPNYAMQHQLSSLPRQGSKDLMILHQLYKEIQQHQLQLSRALAVNNMLVQEASSLIPSRPLLPSLPPEPTPLHVPRVKQEHHSDQEEDSLEEGAKKEQKKERTDVKDQQQNHDKNQTKNIPKNYGKAILSFIQKNVQKHSAIIKPILQKGRLTVSDLLSHIKKHKKEVNSINYLKQIWGYQDKANPILKCIRILSYVFMRKHCLAYIFNSRVKNYSTHIKYRKRIIEGIEHPEEFTCIKQF